MFVDATVPTGFWFDKTSIEKKKAKTFFLLNWTSLKLKFKTILESLGVTFVLICGKIERLCNF
jgi:hypothetical protein